MKKAPLFAPSPKEREREIEREREKRKIEREKMKIGFPTPELLAALRGYPGLIFVHDQEFKVNEDHPFCRHVLDTELQAAKTILPMASDYKWITDYYDEHYSGRILN